MPPRFAQDVVAHFMSLTQIVSAHDVRLLADRATSTPSRRCSERSCSTASAKTRLWRCSPMPNAQVEANKMGGLDAANTAEAKTLAIRGKTKTVLATMLDYAIYKGKSDDAPRPYVDLFCAEPASTRTADGSLSCRRAVGPLLSLRNVRVE